MLLLTLSVVPFVLKCSLSFMFCDCFLYAWMCVWGEVICVYVSYLWIILYHFLFILSFLFLPIALLLFSHSVVATVNKIRGLSLCDPMDCSTPSFPVLHHLPEFLQTHVYWVSDAIQPSHLLSSSPPAFNLSQHQGLF